MSKQPKLESIISDIISEFIRIHTSPTPDDSNEFHPSIIPSGDGGGFLVSRTIDQRIDQYANRMMEGRHSRFTDDEWISEVREALGFSLGEIDISDDLERSASLIHTNIKKYLNRDTLDDDEREFVFGCTLFFSGRIKLFNIGPVKFEMREDWISRAEQELSLNPSIKDNVKQRWSGDNVEELSPPDNFLENTIVSATEEALVVCSVETKRLTPKAGRRNALLAARLALSIITLCWPVPSQILDGMNLSSDRKKHSKSLLHCSSKKGWLNGWRLFHIPRISAENLESVFKGNQWLFNAGGKVLDYLVSPDASAQQPEVMKTLLHALIFFHEGCREEDNLMAIINFAATLDALSCGRKEKGILCLIKARLDLEKDAEINSSKMTVQNAIKEIYKCGRSQTLHGTNDKLLYDWATMRKIAESFAHQLLIACIDWVNKNPKCNDPRDLINPK